MKILKSSVEKDEEVEELRLTNAIDGERPILFSVYRSL
jgi:hypothetical protein